MHFWDTLDTGAVLPVYKIKKLDQKAIIYYYQPIQVHLCEPHGIRPARWWSINTVRMWSLIYFVVSRTWWYSYAENVYFRFLVFTTDKELRPLEIVTFAFITSQKMIQQKFDRRRQTLCSVFRKFRYSSTFEVANSQIVRKMLCSRTFFI